MYVRVVRFTDVTPDRIASVKARVEAAGGPPPGVDGKGLQFLVDEQQGTAVVLQLFETAEAMQAADAIFSAMEPGETPGTRASVDRCEVQIEMRA